MTETAGLLASNRKLLMNLPDVITIPGLGEFMEHRRLSDERVIIRSILLNNLLVLQLNNETGEIDYCPYTVRADVKEVQDA